MKKRGNTEELCIMTVAAAGQRRRKVNIELGEDGTMKHHHILPLLTKGLGLMIGEEEEKVRQRTGAIHPEDGRRTRES